MGQELSEIASRTRDPRIGPRHSLIVHSVARWITNAKLQTAALMGAGKIEGIVEDDHQVEMRDGHKITCRTHRPEKNPEGGSPLFVVYHGGGWCIGTFDGCAYCVGWL